MTSPVHALRETQPSVMLVERLISAGLISKLQLRHALQEKAQQDRPLGQVLVELGMISENVLHETLHNLLGDRHLDLQSLLPDPRAVEMVPREIAERFKVLPIDFDNDARLLLAVTAASDLTADNGLLQAIDSGLDVATVVAAEPDIAMAIRKFYGVALTIPNILREIDGLETGRLDITGDASSYVNPLVRLVDAIIFEAARRRATHIHFEPEPGFLRVRFRIDGVLMQAMALHKSCWRGMAERLQEMSSTDNDLGKAWGERCAPLALGQRQVTLYFSQALSQKGIGFVVRIVDNVEETRPLEELGLDSETLNRLRLLLARPQGLLLVAGPPGHGKSSTMRSILSYRSDESLSIMTHADAPASGLLLHRQAVEADTDSGESGFGPDSLQQQDADVLAVDELRNARTAAIALSAAGGGRQVLAALPAGSALAGLAKLQEFGLQPRQLCGNVNGVLAQSLLRKLCPDCKRAYAPEPFERDLLGLSESHVLHVYREVGCEKCDYLGFKGRIAVFEVLVMDEQLAELVEQGVASIQLRRAARAAVSISLVDATIRQVLAGATSIAEASRVVDFSARLN